MLPPEELFTAARRTARGSTPDSLKNRRSSMAMIAASIERAIPLYTTGSRYWSNRLAIGAPLRSSTVVTNGTCAAVS